ncbi:hypothetical protein N7492_003013 [Penicillium capsulatum]|uniref:Transcription regulator BDF1 n=1 Tax=Penicillium capsulatum TaxID=69766 RepID=A0A9W9IIM2_9EURO|nr:hypothetical protein N7492_003013 [Penicillium capsulatum]KAJ6122396.1 hypothetical protein N7512_004861 [Penicillium capsulatum]
MATPPPEAAPVLKEEKPQLPPSPTGAPASDVAPVSEQDTSPKLDAPPAPENNGTTMNGHTPPTNGTGTAASPPKSPAPAPTTVTPAPTELKEVTKAPEEINSAPQPSTTELAPTDVAMASDKHSPTKEVEKPNPTALDGATDAPDQMNIDGPVDAPAPAQTELPHHPTVDTPAPSLPPLQTDHEMKDAPSVPLSPSKIPREREAEPEEEPAPKRTKVEGDSATATETRVPELPTPAAETPGPAPNGGQTGISKMQHKFISKSITSLKRMHDSRFYREPVDPIKLNIPNYHNVITRPMDLGTIEKKLKANEYASPQAVSDDFALMVQNAATFNGKEHLVAVEGEKLKATFEKQMSNLPSADEVEEKKPKKVTEKTSAARREPRASLPSQTKAASPQSTTFALGPEGLPVIRRDSSNPDGRPKRSIHPPKRDLPYSTKPKKKKYQWELRFCQDVLDELHKQKHSYIAAAFYYPVDPVALNIPTYHSVIKKPMDLSTIQTKLRTGQYENSKEFESDIRLMFKNCYRFNLPGDPTYVAGQSLEEVFDTKWATKTDYLEKHEPPQEQTDSSDEDSDDDDQESDEDDEKLSALQKQIAEMSRQVELITQKKKKTPPSSKKAGKAKTAKKEGGKKRDSSKKSKKSKGLKSDKGRYVSYHEKQIISNGISSLPDKKMQEALQIIQNNVPTLKGAQETEIELDIDELPNNVLVLLLKFVRANVPSLMDDEETAPTNVAAPKPKKNKPMSKFEQEAQINMLENNLSRFQGGGGRSPDPVPSVEADDSSEDESEDDSEESEEE